MYSREPRAGTASSSCASPASPPSPARKQNSAPAGAREREAVGSYQRGVLQPLPPSPRRSRHQRLRRRPWRQSDASKPRSRRRNETAQNFCPPPKWMTAAPVRYIHPLLRLGIKKRRIDVRLGSPRRRTAHHQPKQAAGRGQGKIIPAATESLNTTAPPDGSSGSRRGRSERTHNTGGEPIGMGGDNEIWVEAKQQEEQQPG
jgi:hypothetical protein